MSKPDPKIDNIESNENALPEANNDISDASPAREDDDHSQEDNNNNIRQENNSITNDDVDNNYDHENDKTEDNNNPPPMDNSDISDANLARDEDDLNHNQSTDSNISSSVIHDDWMHAISSEDSNFNDDEGKHTT